MPGFTKPLIEADWSDAPAPIKASFYTIGVGFALAADEFVIGPALGRMAGAVRGLMRLVRGAPALRYGEKIEKQLGKRGWDKTSVESTVNKPARTQEAQDTRNLPDGSKMNDSATVYFDKEGNYVVVNDKTGDIVQVSNKNDPNWQPPPPK